MPFIRYDEDVHIMVQDYLSSYDFLTVLFECHLSTFVQRNISLKLLLSKSEGTRQLRFWIKFHDSEIPLDREKIYFYG